MEKLTNSVNVILDLLGDHATKAQLALYRHHVANGTVPKNVPPWAKKAPVHKVPAIPKGAVYPAWTYKRAIKNIPAQIPGVQFDGVSTSKYVAEFDRLNGFTN